MDTVMYGFADNVKEKLPGNLAVFVQAGFAVMAAPPLKAEMTVNAQTTHPGPDRAGCTPGLSPV
jgi:hypothetical protein